MEHKVYLSAVSTKLGSDIKTPEAVAEECDIKDPGELRRIIRRAGPTQLFRFAPNESLEDASQEVSQAAIRHAGLSLKDIQGIYTSTACATTLDLMPSLARVLGDRLGLNNINLTPVGLGCVGGLDAILQARNQLVVDSLENRSSNYLVVVGDQTSRSLERGDRATAFLFSEGVSAVIMTNNPITDGYELSRIATSGLEADGFAMRLPNPLATPTATRFRMDGNAVYEFAVKKAIPRIPLLLGFENIPQNCYIIPHQGSRAVVNQVSLQLGVDADRVYTRGIEDIGNTNGASTLFGLADALSGGLIGPNQSVILGVFGADMKVGAAYLEPRGVPAKIMGLSSFQQSRSN